MRRYPSIVTLALAALAAIVVIAAATELLSEERAVHVMLPTPTPAPPQPTPTPTPKPAPLPTDAAALRVLWLPSPECGIADTPAGAQWLAGLGMQCPLAERWAGAETGALGSGVVHLPDCAANDAGLGRYAFFTPADYPAPTELVLDGINQLGVWQGQQTHYAPPRGGVTYRAYVTAYRQYCHTWAGDRVDIAPHPMPTPTPTPMPTPDSGGEGG